MNLPNSIPSPARHAVPRLGLPASMLALLWLVLQDVSAAELRVQIIERGAGPLADAAVCLGTPADPAQFGAERSGPDGRVVFEELPSAPLVLTVSKEGYLGREVPLESMYAEHTLAVQIPTGGGGPSCDVQVIAQGAAPPNELTISGFRIEPAGYDDDKGRQVRLVHELNGKATHYRVSESPEISGKDWRPYKQAPQFRLSDGGGEKTLYLQVRRYSERGGAWLETRSNVATATVNVPERQ